MSDATARTANPLSKAVRNFCTTDLESLREIPFGAWDHLNDADFARFIHRCAGRHAVELMVAWDKIAHRLSSNPAQESVLLRKVSARVTITYQTLPALMSAPIKARRAVIDNMPPFHTRRPARNQPRGNMLRPAMKLMMATMLDLGSGYAWGFFESAMVKFEPVKPDARARAARACLLEFTVSGSLKGWQVKQLDGLVEVITDWEQTGAGPH